MYLDRL